MARYNSKDLEITFNGTALTSQGAALDVDESEDALEITGFGYDDDDYIGSGVGNQKATYNGYDDDSETVFDALVPGTDGTLEWYPQGNTAGKPKRSTMAIVTNRKRGFKVKDKVAISATLQLRAGITDSVVSE